MTDLLTHENSPLFNLICCDGNSGQQLVQHSWQRSWRSGAFWGHCEVLDTIVYCALHRVKQKTKDSTVHDHVKQKTEGQYSTVRRIRRRFLSFESRNRCCLGEEWTKTEKELCTGPIFIPIRGSGGSGSGSGVARADTALCLPASPNG